MRLLVQSDAELSSMGADFVTRLAIAEFDVPMAVFDFQTLEGLKQALEDESLFSLRQALVAQVPSPPESGGPARAPRRANNPLMPLVAHNSLTPPPRKRMCRAVGARRA